MPEYLAPGVYLEEIDANVTPIPGVSTSTIDTATARALLVAIEPIVKKAVPDWTGFNESDPGVTLVQLFAFVAEGLIYRSGPGERRQLDAALRAVDDVAHAAGCAVARATLKRPTFFDGRMLDAATLRREQEYVRDKHRRHNLNVHGFGIVSGLEVSVDTSDDSHGGRVVVEPGYAIDRCGEETAIGERVCVPLPVDRNEAFVALTHWEQRCAASAAQARNDVDCVEEACLISVAAVVSPCALALARLIRPDGRWTVDTGFVAPRGRSR